MADRTCNRCGTVFPKPFKLARHLARKTACELVLERDVGLVVGNGNQVCRFCNRGFSCYTAMRRHVREHCKVAPNAKNGDSGMERLYDHTVQKQITELKAQNAQQSAQITEILALLRQGASSSSSAQVAGHVAIQGNQNEVDNSKKIYINIFGQEKLDHVTAGRIKTILDECLQRPALPTAVDEAVLRTAMLVYSDPSRPENLTAYLPNKKTNDALVHTEAGWEVQPTTLVLPPMAQKSIDTLFEKQPYEDAESYAPLLKELQQNEERFAAGEDLRPVLVRNKDLLTRALATLPVAGQ